MKLLAFSLVVVLAWWLPGIAEEAWAIRKRRRIVNQRLEDILRAQRDLALDLTVERLAARAECAGAYPRMARRRIRMSDRSA